MRVVRWMGLLLVVCLCSVGTQVALAQTGAQSFNLPPNGKATVTFKALCVVFGKKFPSAINGPSTVSSDTVQAALSYAESKGYLSDEQQAQQVQYAIWQLLNQGGPEGGPITQDVIAHAQNPPAPPQGVSLVDAVAANQVKLTIDSWQPIGQPVQITPDATDHFEGQGQLTIENTSQQPLTLYMPIGTVFTAANPDEQSIGGYATNVQVTSPQPAPQNASNNLPETSQGVAQALMPLFALFLLGAAVSVRIARKIRM